MIVFSRSFRSHNGFMQHRLQCNIYKFAAIRLITFHLDLIEGGDPAGITVGTFDGWTQMLPFDPDTLVQPLDSYQEEMIFKSCSVAISCSGGFLQLTMKTCLRSGGLGASVFIAPRKASQPFPSPATCHILAPSQPFSSCRVPQLFSSHPPGRREVEMELIKRWIRLNVWAGFCFLTWTKVLRVRAQTARLVQQRYNELIFTTLWRKDFCCSVLLNTNRKCSKWLKLV